MIVVDSGSTDRTAAIAKDYGAKVINFTWNGVYPKKRQWCLDNLETRHDWIFFVDADEVVLPELTQEIRALDFRRAGYFVRGRYVLDGRVLRFGLMNNKLVLFDKSKVEFPVVDDLDAPGMGEMEGHYQPVLKPGFENEDIGQLCQAMLHYACEDMKAWTARHERYAAWERAMNAKAAWPEDPVQARNTIKKTLKRLPFWPLMAFFHSYVLKLGFLDGRAGFHLAFSRYAYYRMI